MLATCCDINRRDPSITPKSPFHERITRDDNHFLAAADAGRVDCLITGDPHLLTLGSSKGIPILSPADILSRFFPSNAWLHRPLPSLKATVGNN